MNQKKLIVYVSIIIIAFVALILISRDFITPYISVEEAIAFANDRRQNKYYGKRIQIRAEADISKPFQWIENEMFFFVKSENGTVLRVKYSQSLPDNFHHSEALVISGFYDFDKRIFNADKILMKCPSKYESELK